MANLIAFYNYFWMNCAHLNLLQLTFPLTGNKNDTNNNKYNYHLRYFAEGMATE